MASDPVAKASSSESQLTPEDILGEIEESYSRYVDSDGKDLIMEWATSKSLKRRVSS
jgi:hypothetical protein